MGQGRGQGQGEGKGEVSQGGVAVQRFCIWLYPCESPPLVLRLLPVHTGLQADIQKTNHHIATHGHVVYLAPTPDRHHLVIQPPDSHPPALTFSLLDLPHLHAHTDKRLGLLLRVRHDVLIKDHASGGGANEDTSGPAVLPCQRAPSILVLVLRFPLPNAPRHRGQLTWNQPSSSPLASLSPGFFDQPIEPTSMATT